MRRLARRRKHQNVTLCVQVEDEMSDTKTLMTAFKRKVKDDLLQLERRLRVLTKKVK